MLKKKQAVSVFDISDKHHTVFLASLAMCLVALPFSRAIMSISLIILTINWLWQGNILNKLQQLSGSIFALILIGFFLIHLGGLLYSENQLAAWNDLQVKLPLLLFPLILASSPRIAKEEFIFLIKSFIASCLLAALLCLTIALVNFLEAGYSFADVIGAKAFNYEYLSRNLNQHPTYFSLLINLAMLGLSWLWYQQRNTASILTHLVNAVILSFLLAFLMLLSAKMQIIAFLLITVSGLIYRAIKQAKWKSSLVFIGFMLVLMTGILALNPFNHSQMKVLVQPNEEGHQKVTSRNVRINIWKAVAEVASENSWIGVGIGDRSEVLSNTYEEFEYAYGVEKRFNAHSQYGETMVGLGLLGLLFLLSALIFPIYQSIKQKNLLYLGFTFLLILSFLTESMLTRQMGVFSYALFNGLFAFQMKPN